MGNRNLRLLCAFILALLVTAPAASAPTRLKDLVSIRGVRSNFLNGFGLVVGLKSTGDSKKALATNKAVANMLTRMGMKTLPEEVVTGSIAAVLVTAELPPFARNGDLIDLKVSTIGDARSLAGGTLILTPLKGGNSEVYAMAQGAVSVGQASGNGPQVLTVARVAQGATVEREFHPTLAADGNLTLMLREPDFTTSTRIADAVNRHLRGFVAKAKDLASVEVQVPEAWQADLVGFVAEIEGIKIEADTKSVVVMNERTGTVVMGASVVIAPVAIAHGDLTIKVGDKAAKGKGKSVVAMGGATVGELVETMNALGVKPADLIGILQAIHAAGALNAELKFL